MAKPKPKNPLMKAIKPEPKPAAKAVPKGNPIRKIADGIVPTPKLTPVSKVNPLPQLDLKPMLHKVTKGTGVKYDSPSGSAPKPMLHKVTKETKFKPDPKSKAKRK